MSGYLIVAVMFMCRLSARGDGTYLNEKLLL